MVAPDHDEVPEAEQCVADQVRFRPAVTDVAQHDQAVVVGVEACPLDHLGDRAVGAVRVAHCECSHH